MEQNDTAVFQPNSQPRNSALSRAFELLKYGTWSVNSLYSLYESVTQERGRGAPTHEDQDLLRAMLVMAEMLASLIVDELAGQSLQSTEQLRMAAKLLGLDEASVVDEKQSRAALQARNQIVHEMDAVLGAAKRKAGQKGRRQRRKSEMVAFSNCLLEVADKFIQQTDKELGS